jgi:hypothetical protein
VGTTMPTTPSGRQSTREAAWITNPSRDRRPLLGPRILDRLRGTLSPEGQFDNLITPVQTTFTDDTTLRRAPADRHLPYVYVQASLSCRPDHPAIALMREAARSPNFKWTSVRPLIRTRDSLVAGRVRRLLEEAVITIVDPAAYFRALDVHRPARSAIPPLLSKQMWVDPRLAPYRQFFERRVGRLLLLTSGAETMHALLRSPLVCEWGDHDPNPEPGLLELDPVRLADSIGSLPKVARVALNTTALTAHERDPDQMVFLSPLMSSVRYSWDLSHVNQVRLEGIVARSTVYDQGHKDATDIALQFHQIAQRRVKRAPIYLTGLVETPRGEVRTGVTAQEAELQAVDVATGWASEVLNEQGATALHRTFRLVIYNGMLLNGEEAEKLDSEMRFHNTMIQRL